MEASGSSLVELPELEAGQYLVGYLFEIGTGKPAGMGGLTAIDHQDIAAWQYNVHIRLTPWEAQTLRALSREFCSQFGASSSRNVPPPYTGRVVTDNLKRQQVNNAFKAMAARRKRK